MPMSDPPAARVTKRREATRRRLLEAALDVFTARGFGASSVEDVCAAAGFTRGAFYSNFDSLEELFFALWSEQASRAVQQVAGALAGADAPAPSVSVLVERVVAALTIDRRWALLKTDVVLHVARRPDLAGALAAHRDQLRSALAATLARWLPLDPALGVASQLPPSLHEPQALARAVIAVHDAAMLELVAAGAAATDVRSWLVDLLTALLDHAA